MGAVDIDFGIDDIRSIFARLFNPNPMSTPDAHPSFMIQEKKPISLLRLQALPPDCALLLE